MNKSIRFVMTRMPALAVITLFGAIAGLALKASIEQLIGSNVLDAVVFALTAVLGAYGIHVALVIDRKLRSLSQLKWRLRRVNQVVELPREDSGQQLSIARFHNHTIDSKKRDLSRFFRREPLLIVNPKTGTRVIRYAMGNPGGLSIKGDQVALDYDAVDLLGVRFGKPVELYVRRARRYEVWRWFWFHSDLSIQIAIRIGAIGAILGVIGCSAAMMPFIF